MSEGRPSKFDLAFCDKARDLSERGATDQEMADFFGVHRATFYRWKLEQPAFCDSIKSGKAIADERVERSLYQKASGFDFTEEQAIKIKTVEYGENGRKVRDSERVEIVEVRRHQPAETVAAIFWLKNRRPDNWRDKHEVDFGALGDFDEAELRELSVAVRRLKAGRAGAPAGSGTEETTRH